MEAKRSISCTFGLHGELWEKQVGYNLEEIRERKNKEKTVSLLPAVKVELET